MASELAILLRAHSQRQAEQVRRLEEVRDRLAEVVTANARTFARLASGARCEDCERCTWNPGPDCGKQDHPHCPSCGHCEGRHEGEALEGTTP